MNGSIESCYHNGTVTNSGDTSVGGVVGHISVGKYEDTDTTMKNCYHVGAVNGTEGKSGSIVGLIQDYDETTGNAYITNCYAIKEQANATHNGIASKCEISEVTANMMKFAYADLGEPFVKANSDSINGGFPVFSWQQSDFLMGDVNCDGKITGVDATLLMRYILWRDC